ncbi:hypothetical protein GCM10028807_48590 [Spirosoma daeguense]
MFLIAVQSAYAQYELYPSGFSQVLVADGLSNPTAMAFAPDGRIFVAEQDGKLRVIKNGTLLPTPFVQLNVVSAGEAGLTGVAVDPNFETNNYIYLYHTVNDSPSSYRNRISRFIADGDVALAGSETIILDLDPLPHVEQHNGGAMHFGVDGKLYVGVGESHDPPKSQDLDTYLGKLLRINPDGSVPTDNPFKTGSEQRKRIWAYGLRNPFTFSIDQMTGQIFINDVGEGSWEEINEAAVGGINFGWPYAEGYSNDPEYENPVFAYPHTESRCAITGGLIFKPNTTSYPAELAGKYFYQDFCTSAINTLSLTDSIITPTLFAANLPGMPVGLTVGADGNLYFLSRTGALYKIIYTTETAPAITRNPINVTVPEGRRAQFFVSVSGATPFTFQWRKNGVDISGATSYSYTIPVTARADSGRYSVFVTNGAGSVLSDSATLTLTTADFLPVATIDLPLNHTVYRAGDVITFSGSATDAEDGILPDSVFVWRVELHHDTHFHDSPPIAIGTKNGQYTIPNHGETSANVFYRIILTVHDSGGGTSSTYVDVIPNVVNLSFATVPANQPLFLDGQPITTPYSRSFVSGMKVGLTAPATRTINNIVYYFDHWSIPLDSASRMTIPNSNATFTAFYVPGPCIVPVPVSTTAISATAATANWFAATTPDTTQYQLRWRLEGASTWTIINSLTATNGHGSYQLIGLTNLARYEWQVRSICSRTDSSAFSNSAFFQAATPCVSQYTIKSGSWANPDTWSCNRIPVSGDVVRINHAVTVPVNYNAYARKLIYDTSVPILWENGARLLISP